MFHELFCCLGWFYAKDFFVIAWNFTRLCMSASDIISSRPRATSVPCTLTRILMTIYDCFRALFNICFNDHVNQELIWFLHSMNFLKDFLWKGFFVFVFIHMLSANWTLQDWKSKIQGKVVESILVPFRGTGLITFVQLLYWWRPVISKHLVIMDKTHYCGNK